MQTRIHSAFVEGVRVEVCGCLLFACIFRQRLGDSLSVTRTKRGAFTADDLSRRQEEPHRKRVPLVDEASGDSSEGIPERDELILEEYQEESFSEDDEEDSEFNNQIILSLSPQRLVETDFMPPLQMTLGPCLQCTAKAQSFHSHH